MEAGEIGLSAAGMQETVVSYRGPGAHVLSIRVKLQALIYGGSAICKGGLRSREREIGRHYKRILWVSERHYNS